MTKYKAYPEYKDSGVEWLGIVPSHWKTVSISRLFSRVKRTGYKDKELLSVYRDYGVVPKSSRDDNNNKPSEDLSPYQLVEENDLVMNKMKAWQGSIAISEYEGIVSPAYFVYQPNKIIFELAHLRYVHYLLRNPIYVTQYLSRSKGIRVNQWDLDPDEFRNIELLLPSKNEQEKIYGFLDHETAKIDKLIEKQQQLIERLKEKRQAVISHAVTKGLNPDVPMKDSGVEWLGEVPEHWRVSRVKNFAKIESGHTPSKTKSEYWVNCIIPWVSLNDSKQLKDVDYIDDTTYKISELGMANSSAHLLPARAVVFTRDASIGLSAITTKPMAVSQHLIAWLCNERFVVPEFLLLVFYAMEKEFERYTFGATIKTIGMDNVRGLRSAFPPIDEQHKLIEWAFKKLEKIKFSINKVEDIISLLQERRTALISAAVTGKIDVRDWVAPDMQDAEEPQETTA
ncbi:MULTISPECIES: restriction endonuclease subunit S [Serratia]|uniref:restriction endonuclease subunit S n=1 Tax=Serratia TaxID=613 RepID=UPI00069D69AA|nr:MULTISPECIES: restriction endonuclease subunit S [Serratia]MBH2825461.1 restriction endonuclease subunit S [Serratia marcescens]MBH3305630.1 restriction endonuclease subunit S [Serratia marcescens]PIJ06014.1 restriction endonuclease [Serratia sp. OMLW3]PIJ16584.1 restriction endonuclease [Serratia sp. OLAL2]CAI1657118.1 Type I restriction enzyme EcoKI specificity protein [Serratia marcescens]